VLLDSPILQSICKIGTAETEGTDIKSEGREPGVVRQQDARKTPSCTDFTLDPVDLAFQLGAEQADDLSDTPPVPRSGFRYSQSTPRVDDGVAVRLRCDEQLRIERDVGILAVYLPEHQRRSGPDPGCRTALIPLRMPQVERPFDPLREGINLFL